eukprot:720599-Pleurochrysis_carterae.AAC.2
MRLRCERMRMLTNISLCEFDPRAWCCCNIAVATRKLRAIQSRTSAVYSRRLDGVGLGCGAADGNARLRRQWRRDARRKGNVNGSSEQRKVGYFHQLPTAEREAAVVAAMQMRADARVEARVDIAEQQDYVKHKRAQASERQLAKLAA